MRRDKYNVSFLAGVGDFFCEKFLPKFRFIGRQIKSSGLISSRGKSFHCGIDIKERDDNASDVDKKWARRLVKIFARAKMKNSCAVEIIILLQKCRLVKVKRMIVRS